MTRSKIQRPLIVLYTNGGGIRGLIPAHFMAKIEEVTKLPISSLVDVFTGPSTGAILNAGVNMRHPDHPDQPRYKARHLVRFYEREGINIFPRDAFRTFRGFLHDFNNRTMKIGQLNSLFRHGHYDSANLGRALRALYGRTKLSESLSSLVIPIYNLDGGRFITSQENHETPDSPIHSDAPTHTPGGQAIWLKNLKFEGLRNPRPCPDVTLFDAVMGSTAAPTFFPCHTFNLSPVDGGAPVEIDAIDGSIFDNPCMSYMGAVRQHIPADRPVIMIVIGTGVNNRSISREEWNKYGALGVVDPAHDLPLINIFFHASESALLDAFNTEMGNNIFAFNKSLISGPFVSDYPSEQIDDASPENIHRLRNFFEMTLTENRKTFERLCNLLVENYERKQEENKISPRSILEFWKQNDD